MSIILDVAPEVQQRVEREAAEYGQDAATFLRRIVEERFSAPARTSGLPVDKPDFFSEESIAAWQAMIDSFDAGDPDEQCEALALLQKAVDEDRPGQRRVFGPGYNPPRCCRPPSSGRTQGEPAYRQRTGSLSALM
jgi:hypothetical protein